MKQPELNLFLLTNCITIPHESLFGNVKRLPKLLINGWLNVWPEFPYKSFMVMAIWGLYNIRPHVLMIQLSYWASAACGQGARSTEIRFYIPFPVFSSFIRFRMRMFFLLLWKRFDPLFLCCSGMGPIYPPKNNNMLFKQKFYWITYFWLQFVSEIFFRWIWQEKPTDFRFSNVYVTGRLTLNKEIISFVS